MEMTIPKYRKRRKYINPYDYWHYIYRKTKHFRKLSEKQFIAITNLYIAFMTEQLLEDGSVIVPYLGRIYIVGKVPKEFQYYPVDWIKTKELWKKDPTTEKKKFIRYLNEHSDNVFYYFSWSREGCQALNRNFYYFRPTSTLRKKLSDKIKEGKVYRTI